MTKQSFTIPEGCKAVTVEQVGNQIITTFEPEFKRGDVLIGESGAICIFDKIISNGGYFYDIIALYRGEIYNSDACGFWQTKDYRHATPEEAQLLWDALAKKGKRWNPETMQVEPIKKERWRARVGQNYYTYNQWLKIGLSKENKDEVDVERYYQGRYFQTEEQAERAANRLKSELDKFWEEELR